MSDKPKIAVSLATLESHDHIIGDIERGVKIYKQGGIEFVEQAPGSYLGHVPHIGGFKLSGRRRCKGCRRHKAAQKLL